MKVTQDTLSEDLLSAIDRYVDAKIALRRAEIEEDNCNADGPGVLNYMDATRLSRAEVREAREVLFVAIKKIMFLRPAR